MVQRSREALRVGTEQCPLGQLLWSQWLTYDLVQEAARLGWGRSLSGIVSHDLPKQGWQVDLTHRTNGTEAIVCSWHTHNVRLLGQIVQANESRGMGLT